MVQWLRLGIPNAVGPGSIPGQGTKSPMLQLKGPTCNNEDKRSYMLRLTPDTIKDGSDGGREGEVAEVET